MYHVNVYRYSTHGLTHICTHYYLKRAHVMAELLECNAQPYKVGKYLHHEGVLYRVKNIIYEVVKE